MYFPPLLEKGSSNFPPQSPNLPIQYLHGIEATYPDFVAARRSSARSKIPELSTVMAELEDEGRQARAAESTQLPTRSKDSSKRGQSQGSSRGRYNEGGRSTSRPMGSKKKCAHCDFTGRNGKKYPERALSWWKEDGPSDPKPDSMDEEDFGRRYSYGPQGGSRSHIERRSAVTLIGLINGWKKMGEGTYMGDIIPCGYTSQDECTAN